MEFVKFFYSVLALLLLPFILPMLFYYAYYYSKGYRIPKGTYHYVGYGSKAKRLFVDFPRRFVLDKLTADPDHFREYGVHIIAGEQGAGKSIALTHMLLRFQKMYPKLIVKSNYGYVNETCPIRHWKDIVDSTNGIYGEIDVLDEIQNWFNSNESKNFPPEMLSEVSQQRKQTKIIIGTSQVFGRISKPIREQVTFLYKPFTIFGCLTVVRKYKPKVKSEDGSLDELKLRGMYFFVHDDVIRGSFDTYKKIKKYTSTGFKPEHEQLGYLDSARK